MTLTIIRVEVHVVVGSMVGSPNQKYLVTPVPHDPRTVVHLTAPRAKANGGAVEISIIMI